MSAAPRESSTASIALQRLVPLVEEVHSFLVSARNRFDDEIRRYPTPIPRCDAQFNFLYEQRARLQEQVNRIAGAMAIGLDQQSCVSALEAFVHVPAFTELESEPALRSRAATMVAELGTEAQRDARSPRDTGNSSAQ